MDKTLDADRADVNRHLTVRSLHHKIVASRDQFPPAPRIQMLASSVRPFEINEGVARVLLFTGHMVDAADRAGDKRRFPRTAKAEQIARQLIEDAVLRELADEAGTVFGIASGANGGDILFHEACYRLGVHTAVYLALPQDLFQAASVRPGDADWVERYQAVCSRVPLHVLQTEAHLPDWLTEQPDYNVWQGCNYWMLMSAVATGAKRQTLIALNNPDQNSNGAGGTNDFMQLAKERGVKVVELDARALLPG